MNVITKLKLINTDSFYICMVDITKAMKISVIVFYITLIISFISGIIIRANLMSRLSAIAAEGGGQVPVIGIASWSWFFIILYALPIAAAAFVISLVIIFTVSWIKEKRQIKQQILQQAQQ